MRDLERAGARLRDFGDMRIFVYSCPDGNQ